MFFETEDLGNIYWNAEKAFYQNSSLSTFCPPPFDKVFWKIIILEKTQLHKCLPATWKQKLQVTLNKQSPSITYLNPEQKRNNRNLDIVS